MPNRAKTTDRLTALTWPLRLTWAGLWAERIVRGFWPLWSVVMAAVAAVLLGLHDVAGPAATMAIGAVAVLGAVAALIFGLRRFAIPRRGDALARLDASMPGRPIQAVLDHQAIGQGDPASAAVWQAHQQRMQARLNDARAVEPDLRVAKADPFALRYVAALVLLVALLFGSVQRVQTLGTVPTGSAALASGPAWEGWIEPPAYTRLPSLYLADLNGEVLEIPKGSRVTLRLYGDPGVLTVDQSISPPTPEGAEQATVAFEVQRSGKLAINGPGGRSWDVAMLPDDAPMVRRDGDIEVTYEGQASIPFTALDDFGVVSGRAVIGLDLAAIDRRYGLRRDPEPRDAITVPLPMPIAGDRSEFTENLIEDFAQHAWANLPVTIEYQVMDAAGQDSAPFVEALSLPGRNFFDPMAAAVIEQRQAILWNRDNAADTAMILRAVSNRPDDIFRGAGTYLRFKTVLTRLEDLSSDGLTDEERDEIETAMWDLALVLEEGDLNDAIERLQRAQDRLAEAMKNGASDQEIAELMQELRQATDDYLRHLSRQAQQEAERNPNDQMAQQNQNSMEMSQDDLQRMMDRIQELMEQGRMAEAQEALDQLREMMENMQVTEGQQGQGQPSPGEQAMEGLADTLRQQQGLSDEAFRDLQEQFNPNAQAGQGQQNQGRNGSDGQGQQHDGQGTEGSQSGESGQGQEQSLAERQRALRDGLNQQRRNLPGSDSEAGDRAEQSLERAEGAMDRAEDALRDGDLAQALDNQAQAMEALREGLRDLGEAMAEQSQQTQSQQGMAQGNQSGQQRDPLGRNSGAEGQVGSDDGLLQGEDVYRRARELLDEIRRRTGEGDRPEVELEYLERLLDRF
ncbi:TIGR02302 family protein [Pseudoprimorskyibacter insulae]|uniref:TIGR02302 family protein n=1 Tax=Pseudoprimorskyibacter insulae TaxID=1695997 RepID=A0A2R8AUY9_9RHOB|nr:TIGR02302 family protein [Pseudoprimorskyibacter insulae]SPF79810.1 hypothetical protein PRI8871_01608 [Pseudoprimorskyibacter insulae]